MRNALKNPRIRRLLAAYLGFVAAEWGTWLAVLIYAHDADGPPAVGLVATVQLVPAALAAPIAPHLIARLKRPAPLVFAYGLQALTVGAMATAMLLAPSWLVYVCAAAATTCIGFARPAHASTLVGVARTPGELTAANGAGGTVDGAGIVIGPALVGLGYALVGPAAFTLAAAAVLASACATAATIRVDRWESAQSVPATRAALAEAVRLATDRAGPALASIALVAVWTAAGLLDILIVVLALGEMNGGSGIVGVFNAALGVGGMIAGVAAARMVGSSGVVAAGAGLGIAAVAILAMAALRAPLAVAILLAAVGVGYGLSEVSSRNLLMRLVPARSVGAVFGLMEGVYAASLAVGAGLGPPLLLAVPPFAALAGIGLMLAGAAAAITPALLRVAQRIRVPAAELETLLRVPMLAPLPVPTIEWLARAAQRIDVTGGEVVIREGDPGDLFYAVERGVLRVDAGGHSLGELTVGDYFGEIALLRDIPRTATVTAVTEAALVAIDRDAFLAAVTDHAMASAIAFDAVGNRLARAGTPPG